MTRPFDTLQAAALKGRVRDHWESEVCGTRPGEAHEDRRAYFDAIDAFRYAQDDVVRSFARFEGGRGRKVLEVGLGAGSDFLSWVRAGAIAYGRDLTKASVELVRERLAIEGLQADVGVGDAESLDFPDNFFDIYYSYGVLHHTPDILAALREAQRVLKPGGVLRIMLYHYPSVGTLLVWARYGPLRLRFGGMRRVVSDNVESPGTQVFTRRQARRLVSQAFGNQPVKISTHLWQLDLLTNELSTQYSGRVWRAIRRFYPRSIVRHLLGDRWGTLMTVETVKAA